MKKHQNLHSHTLYCDGSLTPEQMINAAIEKQCYSFGFSGHSYAPYDEKHCMSPENTRKYKTEIAQLKEKYAGKIELYTGIEQDYYSELDQGDVDYIIGAVHFTKKGDALVCIDGGASGQKQGCEEYYGGDYYALAEGYYETVADVAKKTNADIIAHFDLVVKYNFGGKLFDETHTRYRKAALDAMGEILKDCNLFEVNTGAMYRFGKSEPYPSIFLLKELHKRGGEVILSSDSHDAASICHKFDEMKELLKTIGYKYIKKLTKTGFESTKLE